MKQHSRKYIKSAIAYWQKRLDEAIQNGSACAAFGRVVQMPADGWDGEFEFDVVKKITVKSIEDPQSTAVWNFGTGGRRISDIPFAGASAADELSPDEFNDCAINAKGAGLAAILEFLSNGAAVERLQFAVGAVSRFDEIGSEQEFDAFFARIFEEDGFVLDPAAKTIATEQGGVSYTLSFA